MKIIILLITFSILFTSCFDSGGGEEGGAGLFENHQLAENVFALIPATNKSYIENENMDFSFQHASNITVTGTPRVSLEIGSTTVYANYLAGSGTKILTFRYQVQATDNDSDGVVLGSSIELNGGSLQFSNAGVLKDANLNFVTVDESILKVDTKLPEITAITPPNPTNYFLGQNLQFYVIFDEEVEVQGIPAIDINLDSGNKTAQYVSGSGDSTLTFRYIVESSDNDTNGISVNSPINLAGGSITDLSGNTADLNFTPFPMPTTYLKGDLVHITNITPSANNTYTMGQTLYFDYTFSDQVSVTGVPSIDVDLGGMTKSFTYSSGSGTSSLRFEYQVTPGDYDIDGVQITGPSVNLNGGTIRDLSNIDAEIDFNSPLSPGLLVDAEIASVISISPPANNTYVLNNELYFTVVFNRAITVTGTPRLPINLASPATVYADYVSGSTTETLVFRYRVRSGEVDTDGITIGSILDLNTGSLSASNNLTPNLNVSAAVALLNTSSILIDAAAATITNLIPPADNTYTTGQNLDFTVQFSRNVDIVGTPRLSLNLGGSTLYANYLSGSGTSSILFRRLVLVTDQDTDGIGFQSNSIDLNGATIRDSNTDNATIDMTAFIPNMSAVLVNDQVATQLAFVQNPTNTAQGSNIAPGITVELRDASNMLVTSATDSVTLAFGTDPSGSSATLGGTITVAAVAGVATFNNVNIDMAFTGYTLSATATGLTSATSTSFDITAAATQLVMTQNPTNAYENVNINPDITVEIRDATNALVTTATQNVTIAFATDPSAGSAVIGGTLTVAAVGGVATFNDINIDTINTGYTFEFTSTGLTSATSTSFDITLAPATQLAFTQNPTNSVAGVTIAPDITVEIQDASGNIVTTATDNVTLSFGTDPSGTTATLGGTLTVPAVAGIATFSTINIDKAFTGYTLSATATGLTGATSTSFDISPATKSKLAFIQQPSNAVINTNINPDITVEIQDFFGNKTTDTDTITLVFNNNAGAGTLAGTVAVAATSGEATFSNIQIDNQGIGYTLDALATGLTLDTSSSFNITTIATQLIITQGPSNSEASAVIAPDITVEIQDASGNLVIDATDSVTISFATDPSVGTAVIGGALSVNAIAGVATFNATTIDLPNTGYAVNFNATGLTQATSGLFNITAPIPTVDITASGNILDANQAAYTVSGNCSENTRVVTLSIGGTPFTPTCTGGTYTTGSIDVSGLAEGSVLITADHSDGTYNATQASISVVKDTDVPDILTNTITANTYALAEVITLTLNFDQVVTVSGSPRVQMYFNSQAVNPLYTTYASGSGSSTLSFNYTVAAGDADPDGISVDALFELNGGSILDANGNPATPNLATTAFASVLVDSAVPSITSFVEPVNATYPDGVGLLFQVNFDEAVNITGTPRISINLGGATVYATYKTGSGTAGLEFEYIVQPGDLDADGITVNSTNIELNGGTIRGLDSDDAVLGFGLHLEPMTGVIVDTASGITPPDQVTGLTTAPTTSNTELALSWAIPNDNGFAITQYSVQYRQQGNSTWINSTPNPTSNFTTVTGLVAGITYEFRVAADNGLLGPYSATQTAEIFDVMSLDPIAWLDATNVNGNGTSPTNGTKVSAWVDLTGAATDATEANVANQPVMEYSAQNGLPAVRFDNHAVGLQGGFTRANGTSLTIVVVGQFDNGYSDKCLFEFRGDGVNNNARGFFIDRRYASNTNFSPVLTKGAFQMWTIENTGGSASVVENGSTTIFNGGILFNTDFTGPGNYTLGDDATGGNRMYGYIAEFLVFDRALTPQDISILQNYLKNKWGTP